MRTLWMVAMVVAAAVLAARTAQADDAPRSPRHFVFFDRERGRINEASFRDTPALRGAQLKYTWKELEPEPGRYNIELIQRDLETLRACGKALFIQVQDVSFDPDIVNVPDYLVRDPAYSGGAAIQYRFNNDDEDTAVPLGWVARRWDSKVIERFGLLLAALGRELDGKIEGLNLAETAVTFGERADRIPAGFTHEAYRDGIKAIMKAARSAFRRSTVLVYANFMPGEWLPSDDRGYLKSIHSYAAEIGMGVGNPDLLPLRKGQLNHSYPLIHGRPEGVVAGVAVQWGNYEAIRPATGQRISVAEIEAYGREYLRLDYIFWCTQEPYYSEEVIPFLRGVPRAEP